MRLSTLATILGLSVAAPCNAQPTSPLIGAWTVDLRPKPDAPAYLKPMTLSVASDGKLTGIFYERTIDEGRAGTTSGRPCFAFRTADNSGPYQTSGCLIGDRIDGQTWSEGRNFVLTWTAVRSSAPTAR